MAYRELGVIELREVWRRYSAGDGVRAIARGTGVDRKTIAKYVAAAVAVGLSRGAPPPTDEQLAAFVRGLRGTPVGRPAALPERLAPYQAQIAAWLADGLRLTKIHRRLREQGLGVPYSSLHRFAQAHCGFGAPSVTVRVADPPPGEAAEADFGRLGVWPDPATGSRRYCVRTPRHAGLQPVRLPVGRAPPGPADGPRGAGGGVDLLSGRGAPARGRQSQARRHARRSLRAPDRPGLPRVRPAPRLPRRPGRARGTPPGNRRSSAGIPYVRQDFFRGEVFRDLDDMQARAVTLVPRPGRHPPPRHHAPRPARRVRGRGAVHAPAAGARALRSADLGPVHRPPRSPHPVPAGPLLRPDPLHRRRGRRPRRLAPGPDLSPRRADQSPSAAAARRAVDGLHRLPDGADALRDARARRVHPPRDRGRPRRRPVRDRPAQRDLPVGPPPPGAEAPAAGRALRRRPRQRRLRARPGLRPRRGPPRGGDRPDRPRTRAPRARARHRRPAPGALRPPAAELCPSPRSRREEE